MTNKEIESINILIERIKNMNPGEEFIFSTIANDLEGDIMLITTETLNKLKESNIKIKSKFDDNAIIGLPQNTPYIKE